VAKLWRSVWQPTLFSTPPPVAARFNAACTMSSDAWWRRTPLERERRIGNFV
jgi:hypothetical protein